MADETSLWNAPHGNVMRRALTTTSSTARDQASYTNGAEQIFSRMWGRDRASPPYRWDVFGSLPSRERVARGSPLVGEGTPGSGRNHARDGRADLD
jgi:hypothetical protein